MHSLAVRFFLPALCTIMGLTPLSAEETRIHGGHPSYAGATIHFYIGDNPFLNKPSWSEEVSCNRKGRFDLSFPLEQDAFLRISTGAHLLGLYVEAGGEYELVLPEKPELSYQELSSPYFTPREIYLNPEEGTGDLNRGLLDVENRFNELNSIVLNDRMKQKDIQLDSLLAILDTAGIRTVHPWLDRYRNYKTGILVLNAGNTGLEEVAINYLGAEPEPRHPAYMELFKGMFSDFLIYYDHTERGKGILQQVNRTRDLDSIRWQIMKHPAVPNLATCDLLLLQELPGLFYSGNFHKEAILILLDSLAAHPSAPDYDRYAREVRHSLASLIPGNPPPAFQLKDIHGKSYGPGDFAGKYTYLMFCTPDHYGCMMEYPFLESYLKKHSAYLEVVCVMMADNEEAVKEFMDRNGYSFHALYYDENRDLLDKYLVRAFPVAYLLDGEGKLILSPAPLPSDQFEFVLFRIMRSRGDI